MILRESNSSRGTLDNKFNLHHREQYYATVKKPLKSPVRDLPTLERIPGMNIFLSLEQKSNKSIQSDLNL